LAKKKAYQMDVKMGHKTDFRLVDTMVALLVEKYGILKADKLEWMKGW
jgi:hypothetical protein